MKTACFRGGCLTGPNHSGAELHGFLAYLMKCCVTGDQYTVFGYKGKQVRDNIHSYDLITAFDAFFEKPQSGQVYNIGGGRQNSCSVLEAIEAPSVQESDSLYRREKIFQDDFNFTPLEATIVSVRVHHDGRFSVELDNGETWRETRRGTRVRLPEPGDAVEVYKEGPGGHRMRIEGNSRVAWVRRSDERR